MLGKLVAKKQTNIRKNQNKNVFKKKGVDGQKAKKKWNFEEMAFLGLFTKQKHKNTEEKKHQKTKNRPKNTFLHVGKQPLMLVFFCSSYTLSCLQSCVC